MAPRAPALGRGASGATRRRPIREWTTARRGGARRGGARISPPPMVGGTTPGAAGARTGVQRGNPSGSRDPAVPVGRPSRRCGTAWPDGYGASTGRTGPRDPPSPPRAKDRGEPAHPSRAGRSRLDPPATTAPVRKRDWRRRASASGTGTHLDKHGTPPSARPRRPWPTGLEGTSTRRRLSSARRGRPPLEPQDFARRLPPPTIRRVHAARRARGSARPPPALDPGDPCPMRQARLGEPMPRRRKDREHLLTRHIAPAEPLIQRGTVVPARGPLRLSAMVAECSEQGCVRGKGTPSARSAPVRPPDLAVPREARAPPTAPPEPSSGAQPSAPRTARAPATARPPRRSGTSVPPRTQGGDGLEAGGNVSGVLIGPRRPQVLDVEAAGRRTGTVRAESRGPRPPRPHAASHRSARSANRQAWLSPAGATRRTVAAAGAPAANRWGHRPRTAGRCAWQRCSTATSSSPCAPVTDGGKGRGTMSRRPRQLGPGGQGRLDHPPRAAAVPGHEAVLQPLGPRRPPATAPRRAGSGR